jgi:hypothetical protein
VFLDDDSRQGSVNGFSVKAYQDSDNTFATSRREGRVRWLKATWGPTLVVPSTRVASETANLHAT